MNYSSKEIRIAGAGPAGLTAAIILAKHGYKVKVFEQRSKIGDRFNDDYQGLENWSRDEDVLQEIQDVGVEINWWSKPFSGGVLYDPYLRPINVYSNRPLFYMVRRGNRHPQSLDLALFEQAKRNGVEFTFNSRVKPQGADILATGPSGAPQAIAAGITFKIDREDLACAILNEELAPSGYVYFLVSEGQATLATVLFKDFAKVHHFLEVSKAAISKLYGLPSQIEGVKWGGYGGFSIPVSCEKEGRLWIGEAGGFQDFLFGFGIRNAMISAKLAAISILENKSYDELWKERLLPHLKASAVNRGIYAGLGDFAKKALWRFTGNNQNPEQFMKWLYNYSILHKVCFPFLPKTYNVLSI